MCKYCEDKAPLMHYEEYEMIAFGPEYEYCDRVCIIDRCHLRVVAPDDCECIDHGECKEIKYCPMCGRELNKKVIVCYECPVCGASVEEGKDECPECRSVVR